MPPLDLQYRLCIGQHAVPLEKDKKDFEDLHGVGNDEDLEVKEEEQPFWLLTFKVVLRVMGSMWIMSYLNIKTYPVWVKYLQKMPILNEIREAIDKGKPRLEAKNLSRKPDVVVALKIRGRVLYVVNKAQPVTLAFPVKDTSLKSMLTWFLGELAKDIMTMDAKTEADEEQEASGSSIPDRPSKAARVQKTYKQCQESLDHFQLAVESLKKHPLCKRAQYLPSKRSIRLFLEGKEGFQEFHIKGLGKAELSAIPSRGCGYWEKAEESLSQCIQTCRQYLDNRHLHDEGPQEHQDHDEGPQEHQDDE